MTRDRGLDAMAGNQPQAGHLTGVLAACTRIEMVHGDVRPQTGPGVSPAHVFVPPAVYLGGFAPPERTLPDVLAATVAANPDAIALDDDTTRVTYRELWRHVADLSARLRSAGIGVGDRVGIRMSSGTTDLYVAILGVLAAGAAYVPTDADDPQERAETVWREAGVCAVLQNGPALILRPAVRPRGEQRAVTPADDAWIIFTSGSTGTPKGVAVTHRSAAAFVDAEARLFCQDSPLGPGDRVLAGLSVAFDASCEEMWLAWRHGACLVPTPRALMRTGPELVGWLVRRQITVVSTVPTMAALWQTDHLPDLRLLILGGEACPAALADRLTKRCAQVWNTYGPTEATVVATAAQMSAGEPVRIGLPLQGWRVAVVDPDSGEPVPWGGVGELVIGGAGLGRYLDAEQDADKFRPLEALGWGRAYRSGDLVRADREGLVYVGRADSQVKIRGFRIELSEIESRLLELPGVAQAAVTTVETQPGLVELAAYYSLHDQDTALGRQDVVEQLRRRLPAHMVPAYVEQLPTIPLLPTGKADRKSLPPPGRRSLTVDGIHVPPATETERVLAESLAEVLHLEQVSVDSHFFQDLGASSLLVAHFCAGVRRRGGTGFPAVSTRDVYLHPTVRELATAVSHAVPAPGTSDPAARPDHCTTEQDLARRGIGTRTGAGAKAGARASSFRMLACGTAQFLVFLLSLGITMGVATSGIGWVSNADGWTETYLRALAFTAGAFAVLISLPIAAKWTLIGRWKPQEFEVWGPAYLRFWLVKTLIRTSPLAMLRGSPLYVLYLRALGARIGRRAVILSRPVPVCTDLLTIGDDVVILRTSSFTGYRARSGMIRTGAVSIGSRAFVGEHTVLDIDTGLGTDAELGHSSSLHSGQVVPDGQRWHGSPAQPTDVVHRRVATLPVHPMRRILHGLVQVLTLIFVTMPLVLGAMGRLVALPVVTALSGRGPGLLAGWGFYAQSLALSTALFVIGLLVLVGIVLTAPRVLDLFITPGRTYRLFGVHHALHRAIVRLTNNAYLLNLTGDSSYVVDYLRALGYRMRHVEQTGSNFGAALHHETPFRVEIGRGTMVSDGASLISAEYSSTAWRTSPVSIGARNFLGNFVAYPTGGRTGSNCLIATKALVPLDGPVRENVGLLGSPSFEIPRSVTDDPRFDHLKTGEEFRRRLAAKDRHNLATIGLFLLAQWVQLSVATLLTLTIATLYRWDSWPQAAAGLGVTTLTILLFGLAYSVLVERMVGWFSRLAPQYCSIYQPYFWWHERYWKMLTPLVGIFNGTPFKSVIWRLLGVRVGKRLFDDGCGISERSLVTIGDDCTLNTGSLVQCHSMEDGTFKSDHTVLESGCTLGVGAFIHYGVTIGRNATILPDSFLMKGETVPDGARWGGNPARVM
jgi:non-ribosomal peptide synthetase-like protein